MTLNITKTTKTFRRHRFIRLGIKSVQCAVAIPTSILPNFSQCSNSLFTAEESFLREEPSKISAFCFSDASNSGGLGFWDRCKAWIVGSLDTRHPAACIEHVGPGEICSHVIIGERSKRISSDDPCKTIFLNNLKGRQRLTLEDSVQARTVKFHNFHGTSSVYIEPSRGRREVFITNRGSGTSEVAVDASSATPRILTITTQNCRFKRQYFVPKDFKFRVEAEGPNEEGLLVTISGTAEEDINMHDASLLPRVPERLVIEEYRERANGTKLLEFEHAGNDKERNVVVYKKRSTSNETD